MKNLDPYRELGLQRDASEDEVRSAYRRTAKRVHPDANKEPDAAEAFDRVRRSQLVLLDPERRRKFDQTGTVDEEQPDNTRGNALSIIDNFIETAVGEYINSNFEPAKDPRRFDVLAVLRARLNAELGALELQIMAAQKSKTFIADMARRFSGSDAAKPIERGFERRLSKVEAMIAVSREGIECRRVALTIISSYGFIFDAPAEAACAWPDAYWNGTVA